ncbi:MAG: hypothetical protein AAF328_08885 [Planctomycetota bacterium]
MFNQNQEETTFDESMDDAQPPQSMPLLGALTHDDDEGLDPLAYDSAEENKRIATQSAILIAIVALIAGGVLVGMRLTQGSGADAGSSDQLTKIQTFIRKAENPDLVDDKDAQNPNNLGSMIADADAIVSKIATDYPEKAVTLEDVQKNPFELSFLQSSTDSDVSVDFAERRRQDILKALSNEFGMLQLQSIMGSGRRSVAVIDNEFYRLGQRVGSFRVAGIQDGRVGLIPVDFDMRRGDPRYILEIQAETASVSQGLR